MLRIHKIEHLPPFQKLDYFKKNFIHLQMNWMQQRALIKQLQQPKNLRQQQYGRLSNNSDTSVSNKLEVLRPVKNETVAPVQTPKHHQQRMENKLLKQMVITSSINRYFAPNDKIAIFVGDTDTSFCLAYLMSILKSKIPFDIDIVAIHISQHKNFNPAPYRKYQIPFEVVQLPDPILEKKNLSKHPKITITNKRRHELLLTTAKQLGCNKIAMSHSPQKATNRIPKAFFGGSSMLLANKTHSSHNTTHSSHNTTHSSHNTIETIYPMSQCSKQDINTFLKLALSPAETHFESKTASPTTLAQTNISSKSIPARRNKISVKTDSHRSTRSSIIMSPSLLT